MTTPPERRELIAAAAEAVARAWGYDSIAEVESVHDGEAQTLWATADAAYEAVATRVRAQVAEEIAEELFREVGFLSAQIAREHARPAACTDQPQDRTGRHELSALGRRCVNDPEGRDRG
ncbi:MAG TPA: hypothetical protein VFR23_04190 [Jiangellaceae bacterium]|nr:hypothetical protein [Jiangellaceae bacterium]